MARLDLVTTDVSVVGLDNAVDEIGGMRDRALNLRRPLAITANLLEAHVAMVFSTRGARIGAPWDRLAPSTRLARRKRWGYYGRRQPSGAVGAAGPALQWSGRLRRSFKRGGVAHLRRVSRSALTWGSGVRYGVFHDSPRPRRGSLPRRPILAFRDDFQRAQITTEPIRLWIQGVPPGAIMVLMQGRLRLGALGALGG